MEAVLKVKVIHLTSAHPRYDTRIFIKQCMSLANAGYSVSLVVADGHGDETKNHVLIHDIGSPKGRIDRIFNISRKILKKAISLNADIYHLHDPELIPIGLKLRKLGKTVIFDSHEDVPVQIRAKPYLNAPLRYIIGKIFGSYEKYACKRMSAIVAATPFIHDKFLDINPNSININNFPITSELEPSDGWINKQSSVCYIGGLEVVRGIKEIILALEYCNSGVQLKLAGNFSQLEIKNEVKTYPGWQAVDELGFLDRDGIQKTLSKSMAGLVTLHPIINYIDALPVKMFEYMSAGIPVIASDFPLWKNIIEDNNCGICVNPLDPADIAKAIDFLIKNPQEAQNMGNNGRRSVLRKYNWGMEEQKLLSLYQTFNAN